MVYDVAIVGAGPAGASCAFWLAKSGAKVAIFDHSHPREKPCGGIIPQELLEIFPPLGNFKNKKIFVNQIVLKVGDSELVYEPSKRRKLYQVLRSEFDFFILDEAQKAGADWIKAKVKKIRREKTLWNISAEGTNIQSKFIVGADGARSLIRNYVGRKLAPDELVAVSGFTIDEELGRSIAIELRKKCLGFVIPKIGCTYVGIAMRLERAKNLNKTLFDFAQQKGFNIDKSQKWFAAMPYLKASSFRNPKISGDGWLLVGDAACHCDPLTGEGIKYALLGAKIASDCILSKKVDEYRKMCWDSFAKKLSFSARVVRSPLKKLLNVLAVLGSKKNGRD